MRAKAFRYPLTGFIILYLAAFIAVHRSTSLRRPAANLRYWYYSDSPLVETVEFYGFWPIRHIGYHVPGFMSRHYLEATPFDLPPEEDAGA
jgi:hypothetical protein